MKRAFLILLAAASVASAQTYLTVTADTNRVIRTNFSMAISGVSGLQSALDGKMTTNGSAAGLTNFPASLLTTNGSAASLTNFPASLLTINGSASGLTNFPAAILQTNSALTNFPAGLLRTNGNASQLTNFPAANLATATNVLPLVSGGTGATNASGARSALELGSAATNSAGAFQPASANLTNLASNDAANLTNFPSSLLRTNGDASALTNFPASLLRTNGDGSGLSGVAIYPALSNKAAQVLAVTTNETGVEWIPVSNAVTDAALLTNFPTILLRTNGSADGLTNFPSLLLRANGSATALTNFPAELLRTNGSGAALTNLTAANVVGTVALAANVSGVVGLANGGTGAEDSANALVNLLPSYSGNENRVLALNSSATGVVWAVDSGGTANLTNVTNTLGLANGGTGATNAQGALTNFGMFTNVGGGSVGISVVSIVDNLKVTNSGSHVAIGQNVTMSNSGASIAIGSVARVISGSKNIAIGNAAVVSNVANSIQLGEGVNGTSSTIQFLGGGTVNTTEWGYLANASTRGGYAMTNTAAISTNISVTGTNNTNTLVFSNGILVNVTTP